MRMAHVRFAAAFALGLFLVALDLVLPRRRARIETRADPAHDEKRS